MELLRNVRFVSEGFSAKCRKISRLQEKAFQNGIPPQCMRMSVGVDPNSTLVCGVESSEISTKSVLCRMPKSSTQEGGRDREMEVTKPHPIPIAFLLASSSHLSRNCQSWQCGDRRTRARRPWSSPATHRSVSAVNSLDRSHSTDLTALQSLAKNCS